MSLIHSVTVENHSVCCDFRKMGEELIAYKNNTFALCKRLTGSGVSNYVRLQLHTEEGLSKSAKKV